MSAVLEAIEAQHTTEKVKIVTQKLVKAGQDLRWRYDLLSSRRFPVQYYAVALRGAGPDADEVLVIGIECFEADDGHLNISATVTGKDGLVLIEGPSTEIDMPAEAVLMCNPEEAMQRTTLQIQRAFNSLVDWVNAQQPLIQEALARA
jgi:hypothetical protein